MASLRLAASAAVFVAVCAPTPERGQDTDDVLLELGYSSADIARFHDEGVV